MSGFERLTLGLVPSVFGHFELTCAGWSDRMSRPVAAVAATYEPNDPADRIGMSRLSGYQPYQPFEVAQAALCPNVDVADALGRTIESPEDLDAMDIERDGLALIEAQRREAFNFEGRAAYIIGGLAELTTVTERGVVRTILKRWPDRIGEPIMPNGADPIGEVARRYADHVPA